MAIVIRWKGKRTDPRLDVPPRESTVDRNPPALPTEPVAERAGAAVIRANNERTFQVLIERHQRAVYGYLRSRLLQHADAEDLTQEVYLRAYVGWARFDGSSKARAWLLGIARNVLHEYVRRVKRRKEVMWAELCLELETLANCPADQRNEEVCGHLPGCMAALQPNARQALEMHYQAQLRLAEIGRRLNRSEGAVKLLMFRARQAIKHCVNAKIARDP